MTWKWNADRQSADQYRKDIAELSAVAQTAELKGDRVMADFVHNGIDNALDMLRYVEEHPEP
ncbi:hypothetical protein QMK19_38960 [Streptomyces sp. H10-C2]|uniref:hypothetical protein n=1 Tax=unclassified Streptomyces TaxID=2593676 RepID=UPI0024B8E2FC|nr:MULTISPECIES: hypothetical protein [unclassified Streptomyces]MDJ0347157.1 hypothetical protein [Streptomyces sp. PH10-H1]MDJ0375416.1 hypothetical protein [Streptomyces sp. H10-C2]